MWSLEPLALRGARRPAGRPGRARQGCRQEQEWPSEPPVSARLVCAAVTRGGGEAGKRPAVVTVTRVADCERPGHSVWKWRETRRGHRPLARGEGLVADRETKEFVGGFPRGSGSLLPRCCLIHREERGRAGWEGPWHQAVMGREEAAERLPWGVSRAGALPLDPRATPLGAAWGEAGTAEGSGWWKGSGWWGRPGCQPVRVGPAVSDVCTLHLRKSFVLITFLLKCTPPPPPHRQKKKILDRTC